MAPHECRLVTGDQPRRRCASLRDRPTAFVALLFETYCRQRKQHPIGGLVDLDHVILLDQRREDEAIVAEAQVGRITDGARPRAYPPPERYFSVALEAPFRAFLKLGKVL